MSDQGRHVILGAGPVGVALQAHLATDGVDASLLSIVDDPAYDMPGTTPGSIHGADAHAVERACAGASVIYLLLNAHYVDWYEAFPPRLEAAMAAARETAARLVYHDNVYPYGDVAGPLTEDTPMDATTRKGQLRGDMAATFMGAVEGGDFGGVIGRSADMYGPGALNSSFNSTLGQRHFYPLLAGKAVNVVGDIDQPHSYAFVDDVARYLAVLGRREEALGHVWHLPSAPTLSHRELLTIASEQASVEPKLRGSKVSGYVVRVIGRFQADVGEVAELLYQFEKPLLVSHQRFESAFGDHPTTHEVALEQTLEWYRANPLQG